MLCREKVMNNVVCCVTEKQSQIKFNRLDSCTCKKADKQTQAFKSVRAIISLDLIWVPTIALESLTRSQILPLIFTHFWSSLLKKLHVYLFRRGVSPKTSCYSFLCSFSSQSNVPLTVGVVLVLSLLSFARGHFIPCINNSPRSSVQ